MSSALYVLAGVFVLGPPLILGGVAYGIYRLVSYAKEKPSSPSIEPVNDPVPVTDPSEVKTDTAFERNTETTAKIITYKKEARNPNGIAI